MHKEEFLSEDFGRATGMHWTYKQWTMPEGKDEHAVGKILKDIDWNSAELTMLFIELAMLNKELQSIFTECNNKSSSPAGNVRGRILAGVISRFSADDILFFCMRSNNELIKYNEEIKPRKKKLETLAGSKIYWVMSPATLERAEKQVEVMSIKD